MCNQLMRDLMIATRPPAGSAEASAAHESLSALVHKFPVRLMSLLLCPACEMVPCVSGHAAFTLWACDGGTAALCKQASDIMVRLRTIDIWHCLCSALIVTCRMR